MTDRLLALEARKANLEQMAEPESMPRLHPKLAEVYRQHVERLEEALNDSTIRPEATDALRALTRGVETFGQSIIANWARSLALGQGGEKTNRHSLIIAI